jgi:8-oxo-dGTP diphosphatase
MKEENNCCSERKQVGHSEVYELRPKDFVPKVEVAGIYVNINDKVLLLQLSSRKREAGKWGVPAGKLESNESVIEGARRELLEETDIDITSVDMLKSIGKLFIRKPDIDYVYHLFGLNLELFPNIQLSAEHHNHKWVTRIEANALNLMDGAKEALDFYFKAKSYD